MVSWFADPGNRRSGCQMSQASANVRVPKRRDIPVSGIIWIIIVGFVAGIIARFLSPGPNNPSGFILTTVLGIVGAFLATWIGQAIGHYGPNQGAGFITATIGALLVLFIWNRLVASGVIKDYNS